MINNILNIGVRSSTESSSGKAENVSDQVSVLTGYDNTKTIRTINTTEGVCYTMARNNADDNITSQAHFHQSCDNNGDDNLSIESVVMKKSQQSIVHSCDSKSSCQGPNTVLIDIINNL